MAATGEYWASSPLCQPRKESRTRRTSSCGAGASCRPSVRLWLPQLSHPSGAQWAAIPVGDRGSRREPARSAATTADSSVRGRKCRRQAFVASPLPHRARRLAIGVPSTYDVPRGCQLIDDESVVKRERGQ
eukprot:scaffold7029_cov375-Pinguiococcus_pyrenoidosus.AAC.26